jgi:sugar transferase (PEP-CTERM/EpsH1 system associated)
MENGLVNLVNTMAPVRYRHAIACVEEYSVLRHRIRRPDVKVIALHRSNIGVTRLQRRIYELCRELRPAVLHSRGMSGLDSLIPAMLAGVRHRVHGEHGWDVGDVRGEHRGPALVRRLHSPLVSRYVTVSADLSRYLNARVGIRASRISHICNGVDTSRFSPLPGRRSGCLDLPPEFQRADVVVVGTVGRLQPVKDQGTLLRAFAAARRTSPALRASLRLVVVGGGPMLESLRELAKSLEIDREAWLPGPRVDIPEVMRALDVFALPSLNEGISNTVLEALASGVPVIATKVGGNLELVSHDLNGTLIPVGDAEALGRAIVRYASDEALRRRHGCAARQAAIERFSLKTMVSRYTVLYDHLIHGAPLSL